jgi:hypothetical protein
MTLMTSRKQLDFGMESLRAAEARGARREKMEGAEMGRIDGAEKGAEQEEGLRAEGQEGAHWMEEIMETPATPVLKAEPAPTLDDDVLGSPVWRYSMQDDYAQSCPSTPKKVLPRSPLRCPDAPMKPRRRMTCAHSERLKRLLAPLMLSPESLVQ